MADKKISALTAASTPLAGTEVLPIVQSSVTKQVSVANLTVGRAVATAGGSFTDNITQSTAGKGIDFSANTPATGMTSELLNWYEEGAYTPTVASTTGTITSYTATAAYTRIGRSITVVANVTITNAGTGAVALTITLPWTANGSYAFNGSGRENFLTGNMLQAYIAAGGAVVNVVEYDNTTAIATDAQIRVTITYFA